MIDGWELQEGDMAPRSITYRFTFGDGSSLEHRIEMDPATLSMLPGGDSAIPAWAERFRCSRPRCDSGRCLLCAGIACLVERFRDKVSYETCSITVFTRERRYAKETDMQSGLFSILGLCMATSDCPYLAFLKPMARFHMPFSTMEETAFRAAGSFLLRLHFEGRGIAPGEDFHELVEAYKEVSRVNREVVGHIRQQFERDSEANANAIIMLDVLAQNFSLFLEENLAALRPLFR